MLLPLLMAASLCLIPSQNPTKEEIDFAMRVSEAKTVPIIVVLEKSCWDDPSAVASYTPSEQKIRLARNWRDNAGLIVFVHEMRHHWQHEQGWRRESENVVECDAFLLSAQVGYEYKE